MKSVFKSMLVIILFSSILSAMDVLQVQGPSFVNQAGEKIVLQGMSFSDPDKLDKDGHWNKDYFKTAHDWGCDVVRFPVHPRAWKERTPEKYIELIDDGVKWAEAYNMYVIIDWHIIGNLWTQTFQHDMYVTTLEETYDFWRTIARRYSGNATVAFYELYNEPVANETFGDMNWAQLSQLYHNMAQVIRAWDSDTILLVAGFDWAYDLTPVQWRPLELENIAYVSHPYPQKREQPWVEQWEHDWGFVADSYPVIVTEFGFAYEDERGAHMPVVGTEDYAQTIVDYMDKKGMSWTAWVFDPDWAPQMFNDWDYTLTKQGAYFKTYLQPRN